MAQLLCKTAHIFFKMLKLELPHSPTILLTRYEKQEPEERFTLPSSLQYYSQHPRSRSGINVADR
jgi:hypothetical protein